MEKGVVKLGGFAFPLRPDPAVVKGLASIFKRLLGEGFKLAVVAGGGELARELIMAAREAGASEAVCDELGIMASRLNASLLSVFLRPNEVPEIPSDFTSLSRALSSRHITVLGGLQPGQSTDTVAVLAAELMGSKLVVKATDVDGIYTADPKRDPRAEKIPKLTYEEAMRLLSGLPTRAGSYELLDLQAVRLAMRSGISIRVVDGRDPENIYRALKGADVGSLVGP